jgi:hypothetical protein
MGRALLISGIKRTIDCRSIKEDFVILPDFVPISSNGGTSCIRDGPSVLKGKEEAKSQLTALEFPVFVTVESIN